MKPRSPHQDDTADLIMIACLFLALVIFYALTLDPMPIAYSRHALMLD